MIPRIKTLKPLENYTLFVVFDDGKSGFYDVAEDINQIPEFEDLKTIYGLFESVQLDESRTCVFWSDMIDLPSDTIYEHLQEIPEDEPTPDEIKAIEEAKADTSPTVSHDEINWD